MMDIPVITPLPRPLSNRLIAVPALIIKLLHKRRLCTTSTRFPTVIEPDVTTRFLSAVVVINSDVI